MSKCWSEIPTELLYSILSKLSIPDLFRSAAVCSDWSVVVDMVRRHPGDQLPQIPWLVSENQFFINGKNNDRNTYKSFSLSEGRVYDIRIPSRAPHILKSIIVGSSYGWLITATEVSLQLLNPITGVQIDLPSIPTMDDRNLEATKAVLSSDPSRGGDYSVVFIFYNHSTEKEFLFFVSSAGDEKWKIISEGVDYYDDIAFHKGKLYAVSQFDEEDPEVTVVTYDLITLADSTPTGTPVVALPLPDIIWDGALAGHFFCTSFDDLLVARTLTQAFEEHIDKLEVWKVDTEKGATVEVNNLGKNALFLGEASSLCLDASSLPNLKSNSIYILIDLSVNLLVYNMEDESFTSLSLPSLASPKLRLPMLVWFTPNV